MMMPGKWVVFSPEVMIENFGVLRGEWLNESKAAREEEPGARLCCCAGKRKPWNWLVEALRPGERWIRLPTRKYRGGTW